MNETSKFISEEIALEFKEKLKGLASDYLKKIFQREKEICSFGVFTDSDISGFVLYYNTKEGMKGLINSGIEWNKENPDSTLQIDSGKWWMPEWYSESVDDESFFQNDKREKELYLVLEEQINKTRLFETNDHLFNEAFVKYKEEVFDLICQSLKELKDADCFSKVSNDFFLLVQEGDNGVYGSRKESLSKILTKNQLDKYLENDDC